MRRKPALWMAALSVLSTSAFGTVVAHADTVTQTTLQSLYSSQNQSANTDTQAGIQQSEQSNLSSDSSLTTQMQSGDTSPQYVDQSSTNSTVDHTVSGNASSTQSQSNQSNSNMAQGNTPTTLKIQTHASVQSNQTGTAQTSTGKTSMSQSATNVIVGGQLQSVQEQGVTGRTTSYTATQTTTPPLNDNVTLPQPLDGNITVAGYMVFDAQGYALSDVFGNSGTVAHNNRTGHFDSMQPNQPTEVIVAAVNSYGEPVQNTSMTTIYLRSKNTNGAFYDPSLGGYVTSVMIPAGVTGVRLFYTNQGGVSGYDVLDASTTPPFVPRPTYAVVSVLGTSQQQNASVQTGSSTSPTTTLTEKQQVVVKVNDQQQPATATQQAVVQQNATANQSQQADVPTQSGDNSTNVQVTETQTTTVSNNTTASNQANATGSSTPTITVSQTESTSSTKDVQLSQSQSVTAVGPVLDFTLTQSSPSSATLSESIAATGQTDTGATSSTQVNVSINNVTKSYLVPTNGSVTVTEGQSQPSGSGSSSTNVQNTATLSYSDSGGTHVIALE